MFEESIFDDFSFEVSDSFPGDFEASVVLLQVNVDNLIAVGRETHLDLISDLPSLSEFVPLSLIETRVRSLSLLVEEVVQGILEEVLLLMRLTPQSVIVWGKASILQTLDI
mmetsp:Transcript_21079/g.15429  ORF Transcript_21079/g.15429 Transcript_21079/m.15429 type:complete len:111 (+) Transcript_21079:240-572(+)